MNCPICNAWIEPEISNKIWHEEYICEEYICDECGWRIDE